MVLTLDDPSSWPQDVHALLRSGLQSLRGYQEHRIRLDAEIEADPANLMLRVNPPRNPFRDHRDAMVEKIDACLTELSVMAWHFTKLCPDEIAAIQSTGMFLLSPETFAARIQRRFDAGDITRVVADRLRAKNQAHEENRRGQLWFVLTRTLLASSGLDDPLRFWGGEALYNSHDHDPEIEPVLSALGMPCIVEIELPIASVRSFGGLGITIVRVFELANGLEDENRADRQGYTRQAIRADQVLRVITAEDPAFATMRAIREV